MHLNGTPVKEKTPVAAPVLEVANLFLDVPGPGSSIGILEDISLTVYSGEVLGIIGASGSGKSFLAKSIVRLESPGRIQSGTISLNGLELTKKSHREMRRIRGKNVSLIMQNPKKAMDPVFTMGYQLREVFNTQRGEEGRQNKHLFSRIYRKLSEVGISSPKERCAQYPHEWSRGMLQRAQIVMGLSSLPDLLIMDEVTSALDPTICLQILQIIRELKERTCIAMILITHDLSVALEICDRICVMKKGRLVENGLVSDVFSSPEHPYTRELISGFFDEEAY